MEFTKFVRCVQIAVVISCCCATFVKPPHLAVFRHPMLFKPLYKPAIYKYQMKPFFHQQHPPMFSPMIKPHFKVIPVLKPKVFMKPIPLYKKMMPVFIKKMKYRKVPMQMFPRKGIIGYRPPPSINRPRPRVRRPPTRIFRRPLTQPRPRYPQRSYIPSPGPQRPRIYRPPTQHPVFSDILPVQHPVPNPGPLFQPPVVYDRPPVQYPRPNYGPIKSDDDDDDKSDDDDGDEKNDDKSEDDDDDENDDKSDSDDDDKSDDHDDDDKSDDEDDDDEKNDDKSNDGDDDKTDDESDSADDDKSDDGDDDDDDKSDDKSDDDDSDDDDKNDDKRDDKSDSDDDKSDEKVDDDDKSGGDNDDNYDDDSENDDKSDDKSDDDERDGKNYDDDKSDDKSDDDDDKSDDHDHGADYKDGDFSLDKKKNGYHDNDDDNMFDDEIYDTFDTMDEVKTNIARSRKYLEDLIENGGRTNRLTHQPTQQFHPGNTPVQPLNRNEDLIERQNKYQDRYFEKPGNRMMSGGQRNPPFNIPAKRSQGMGNIVGKENEYQENDFESINSNEDLFNNRAQQFAGSIMPVPTTNHLGNLASGDLMVSNMQSRPTNELGNLASGRNHYDDDYFESNEDQLSQQNNQRDIMRPRQINRNGDRFIQESHQFIGSNMRSRPTNELGNLAGRRKDYDDLNFERKGDHLGQPVFRQAIIRYQQTNTNGEFGIQNNEKYFGRMGDRQMQQLNEFEKGDVQVQRTNRRTGNANVNTLVTRQHLNSPDNTQIKQRGQSINYQNNDKRYLENTDEFRRRYANSITESKNQFRL